MDEELKPTINVATPLWRGSPAASYVVSESQSSVVVPPDPSFDQSVFGEASSQNKLPSGSTKITEGSARSSGSTRPQATRLLNASSNRILNKMELQMASGPKWMCIRRFTLALFFIAVICFAAAALVIVIQTPECKVVPKLGWWQEGPLYRIALQSFRDTTGNGIGDLPVYRTSEKIERNGWKIQYKIKKKFEGHIASMISEKQQGTYIKLCAVLLLTMPGTPVFYYGDEIALKDYKESKYPLMRWDKSKYAGFANSVPWISPAYTPVYTPTVNQQSEDPLSTLSFYRTLGKMRIEEQPLQYGDFSVMLNTTNILAYVRQWHETGILVILNFGGAVTYDFTALNLPPTAVLLAKSTNLTQCELIHLQTMVIEANVGYVLRYFKVE
ncbi:4F2 cell-surface antigen heavy chain-like isoform X1 [Mobula hypostoma]|uniref:4F2 cell-surface antigen heavy chain-like isoform X1 n=1 Tax=Mobula hypostoma TaxID=723540 RepID=UPI002FC2A069